MSRQIITLDDLRDYDVIYEGGYSHWEDSDQITIYDGPRGLFSVVYITNEAGTNTVIEEIDFKRALDLVTKYTEIEDEYDRTRAATGPGASYGC